MKYRYIFALVAAVAIFAIPTLALATAITPDIATPEGQTTLRVDLNNYVAWGASALFTVGLTIWGAVKGLLPGPARWFIQVSQIDQVIEAKIRAWISQNADKISGRASFTVDLRNQAARDIVAMALNTGNKFVEKNRGTLIDMVHARLEKYIAENFRDNHG